MFQTTNQEGYFCTAVSHKPLECDPQTSQDPPIETAKRCQRAKSLGGIFRLSLSLQLSLAFGEVAGFFTIGPYGGSINGGTTKWMVCNGKSIYKWIWGYHYFRKRPCMIDEDGNPWQSFSTMIFLFATCSSSSCQTPSGYFEGCGLCEKHPALVKSPNPASHRPFTGL